MDTISKYQQIIEKIIGDYARLRYSDSEVERRTVFDREQNHYLLMILDYSVAMARGSIIHNNTTFRAGARTARRKH